MNLSTIIFGTLEETKHQYALMEKEKRVENDLKEKKIDDVKPIDTLHTKNLEDLAL